MPSMDLALTDLVDAHISILNALPIITYIASSDGDIVFLSKRWDSFVGLHARTSVLEHGYTSVIHADDVARVVADWADARLVGKSYRSEFRMLLADGNACWVMSEAMPIRNAGEDDITGWFGVLTDIDDNKRNAFVIRSQAEFVERLMDASYDCIKVLSLDARLVSMSGNGMKALGIDSFSSVADSQWLEFWTGSDRENAKKAIAEALDGGQGKFIGRYDVLGALRWWDVAVTSLRDEAGKPTQLLAVSRDVTAERQQQEIRANARLRLQARTAVLVDAGNIFLGSLDRMEIIENLTQLVLRAGASFCTIDLIDEDHIHRAAAVHASPAVADMTSRLLTYTPEMRMLHHPTIGVLRTQTARYDNNLSGNTGHLGAVSDAEESVLRALSVVARLAVPIASAEQVFGVLTIYLSSFVELADEYHCFDDDDAHFFTELGRRTGAALSNAQQYHREKHIAFEMQKASLPTILPLIDHVRFTADYRPGNNDLTIGGDWYDAFKLDDSRIVITIGDVIGNGLKAALTMTKLRLAMRAAALADSNPSTILAVAEGVLALEQVETYATAVAAVFDPLTHVLEIANGGHPAPILREPSGEVRAVEVSGMMLGIDKTSKRETVSIEVKAGSALIFFTDGILENTHDIATGYKRLYQAVSTINVHQRGNIAANIVNFILEGDELRDDLAILVATIGVTAKKPIIAPANAEEIVAASA